MLREVPGKREAQHLGSHDAADCRPDPEHTSHLPGRRTSLCRIFDVRKIRERPVRCQHDRPSHFGRSFVDTHVFPVETAIDCIDLLRDGMQRIVQFARSRAWMIRHPFRFLQSVIHNLELALHVVKREVRNSLGQSIHLLQAGQRFPDVAVRRNRAGREALISLVRVSLNRCRHAVQDGVPFLRLKLRREAICAQSLCPSDRSHVRHGHVVFRGRMEQRHAKLNRLRVRAESTPLCESEDSVRIIRIGDRAKRVRDILRNVQGCFPDNRLSCAWMRIRELAREFIDVRSQFHPIFGSRSLRSEFTYSQIFELPDQHVRGADGRELVAVDRHRIESIQSLRHQSLCNGVQQGWISPLAGRFETAPDLASHSTAEAGECAGNRAFAFRIEQVPNVLFRSQGRVEESVLLPFAEFRRGQSCNRSIRLQHLRSRIHRQIDRWLQFEHRCRSFRARNGRMRAVAELLQFSRTVLEVAHQGERFTLDLIRQKSAPNLIDKLIRAC